MKTFLTFIFCLLTFCVHAQPAFEGNYPASQPLAEYFNAETGNRNKSLIYIFYNNEGICDKCAQTIELTEQIFNQFYNGIYNLFVINYAEDNEYNFAAAYQLYEPLAIVLVKINNGEQIGYEKIANPQQMLIIGYDYTDFLTKKINNFLGED